MYPFQKLETFKPTHTTKPSLYFAHTLEFLEFLELNILIIMLNHS